MTLSVRQGGGCRAYLHERPAPRERARMRAEMPMAAIAAAGPKGVSRVSDVPKDAPAAGYYQVHLIDVGTGLSILIRGHDFAMLLDGGSKDDKSGFSGSSNKSRLLAYLYGALGSSGPAKCEPEGDSWPAHNAADEVSIDHLIMSHPHDDHGNMLDEVLTCDHVKNIWEVGVERDAVFYGDFLEKVVEESGATYHTVVAPPADRTRSVGDGDITNPSFRNVADLHRWRPTDARCRRQVQGATQRRGRASRLEPELAGAAGRSRRHQPAPDGRCRVGRPRGSLATRGDIERHLLDDHATEIDVDVLQVGHHGSMTSSRGEFLDAAKPDWALIGVGPYKYGSVRLPDVEVIQALEQRNVRILRTDVNRARER